MPNSLQSSAMVSPASRRATNCSLSSITEHSFQGITPSLYGRKCHLCVRYNVLPMSQVAHLRTTLHAIKGRCSAPLLTLTDPFRSEAAAVRRLEVCGRLE